MEIAFYNGSSIDHIEVEELLFHYPNLEHILNFEINEGILFINKALEKRVENRHFQMWVAIFPYMDKDSYISFDDYTNKLTGKNIVKKSKEEILKEAEEIERKLYEKGGMNNGT